MFRGGSVEDKIIEYITRLSCGKRPKIVEPSWKRFLIECNLASRRFPASRDGKARSEARLVSFTEHMQTHSKGPSLGLPYAQQW